jgi:2-phospho-L-lactate guanylyltransferase
VSRASTPTVEEVGIGAEVVLIPVKAFHQAKRRLDRVLSESERERLVRTMAAHVVAACAPLHVAVVCDDEEVARWAADQGATVLWEPGQGLNGAVRAGVERLAASGARWVTVAHGDLPRARGLGTLSPFDGITLVPDRRDDGTNVLRLPADCDYRFAY